MDESSVRTNMDACRAASVTSVRQLPQTFHIPCLQYLDYMRILSQYDLDATRIALVLKLYSAIAYDYRESILRE